MRPFKSVAERVLRFSGFYLSSEGFRWNGKQSDGVDVKGRKSDRLHKALSARECCAYYESIMTSTNTNVGVKHSNRTIF